jgi:hypothetical protein
MPLGFHVDPSLHLKPGECISAVGNGRKGEMASWKTLLRTADTVKNRDWRGKRDGPLTLALPPRNGREGQVIRFNSLAPNRERGRSLISFYEAG